MRRVLTALALTFALAACGQADDDGAPVNANDREAIEGIVRDYILQNPEIIEEALIELQRRAVQRERDAQIAAITANSDLIFGDARDPVAGASAEDAVVTVVEFFDYRCPYCTVTNDWVQATLAEHGDQVRFVFKEFPVRGEDSVAAARASLATWRMAPEAYVSFHDGLMTASGPLPLERVEEIASRNGIDVDAMRAEMNATDIAAQLDDVRALARALNITGTPFFIVGDQVIPGADMGGLQRALDAALAAG